MIRRHDLRFGSFAQRGFTIVTAIFLLVVLAGLGAFIVAVSTLSSTATGLDVQGARAYQAARVGMEWGLYRQLRDGSCVASSTFAFPDAASLQGLTVTVACTSHPDANGGPTVREIEATACNRPAPDCPGTVGANYVERRVRVVF
jgi:MSHA biogenesis protein MshP